MKIFNFAETPLTVSILRGLVRGDIRGMFSTNVRRAISRSSDIVSEVSQGSEPVYGINTGFGPLCTIRIPAHQTTELQENLLKSHAAGIGEPISIDLSKAMLVLKIQSLAFGYSGIRIETLEQMLWMLDRNIIPVIPSQGSVGASGDLAPLAHMSLPLIGLGKVWYEGSIIRTEHLPDHVGYKALQLHPKEGLALINGTQFIAAHAAEIVYRLDRLIKHADLIGAAMVDALMASHRPFDSALHRLRPFQGSVNSARRIKELLNQSPIADSHIDCEKVQDPYSLRCMPQVHGAAANALYHLEDLLDIEMNAVTDNPIVIDRDNIISGGNFHGEPLALPLDYACLAASEIGSISDRRIYLSLEGKTANVPSFLLRGGGLQSGFMIIQYTSAALASECKTACFPASADSIPTSQGQEDHVSMGSISGRKALKVIENVEKILAIELICAFQALDYHRPLISSNKIMAIRHYVRGKIAFIERDEVMSDLIEQALSIIKSDALIEIAQLNEI